jgi:hypothetical protein
VDDIIIFGRTEENHDIGYQKVIKKLKENNLVINETKLIYKKESVEFLWHDHAERLFRVKEFQI